MSYKDLDRINNLIQAENDRVDDSFMDLFTCDLNKVVLDYFNIAKNPILNVSKKEGGFTVNLSFLVEGIKLFKKI